MINYIFYIHIFLFSYLNDYSLFNHNLISTSIGAESKTREISYKDVATLGSIPFVVSGICGIVSATADSLPIDDEGTIGACFGAITPFSSTFFTIPLHLYIGSSLKKSTAFMIPKLLISIGLWGYSVGIILHGSSMGEELDYTPYYTTLILGNILLGGINVWELADGIKVLKNRKEEGKNASMRIYPFIRKINALSEAFLFLDIDF